MVEIRKYIASILILALLCSLLPSYTGASSDNTSQTIQNEKETINTDNLDEVVKERTESSKTFTDGEGNFVKEIYPEEIHNKVDGNYKTISEELVESDNKGYIETETTNLEFMFPEKLGQDKPLIYQSGEHKLSFELTHASDGEKQTEPTYTSGSVKEDNSITHKSLYPNIDLRHVALNNEVKEDWIMNEYNGINEFHYTIQTDLYGQVEKDGSIEFYENESKEKSVFTLPKPIMVDSNYNDTLGDGVRSTDIHYDLNKKSDDSYELVLNASKEWLSSSKRVFPIYIDPSVSIDALGDTFVMSAYPNNNYNKEWDPSQGEYVLKTGYYDSTTGTNYPFIKFSVIGDLKGATIDSAELAAYVTHSYYVDTKTDIWVDEVKAQWYVDELTWNNKPSSTKITSTSVARDQWAYFDVKNTIQAWVDGTRENYGFKFHTNGNGKTHWKKITAAESAKKAKLVISYHYEKMKNPTVSSYSYGEGKADGYIDVKWSSVHGAKSYDLQMYDGKSYQTIYSGTSTSWSSKGKKIFPKAPYSTSTTYKTDSTGVELPVDPSAFYSAKSGTTTTKKDYGFRVVAKFANGNSPASTAIYKSIPVVQVGIPDIPTVKPYAYPETDTVNKGRGWLDISWKPVTNATGYKVLIWNGTKYKEFSVGKGTSVSTKGKKIWPTDADLKNGLKELYPVELDKSTSIGKGTELPMDPSITYGNGSNRYSIRVKAISAAGDSASSDVNYGYIPLYAPKNAKLTSNLVDMVNNKSSLTVKWDATPSAKYYEVQIADDKTSKTYQIKGKTSFTTEPIYGISSNYSATVKAYFVDDDNASETEQGKITGNRGLSPASNKATASVDPREDLNGLEDYFTYEDHSFGNATASVNVTTGNMVMEFTDQSLFTQGLLGFDFTRYYNSRSTRTSALGQGWTFAGNENLVEVDATSTEPAKVIYYDEDGTKHEFSYDSSNKKYISPKGKYLTLTKETVNGAQGFSLKEKDGFSKIFEGNSSKTKEYRLYAYKDINQNTIRFYYNQDKLSEISEVNHQGEKIRTSIQLTYNADGLINKVGYGSNWKEIGYQNKQLASIVTKDSRTTESITERLSYNSVGQLASYIDGKGNETKYLYDENELKVFDKQEKDASISVSTTYRYDLAKNEFTVTDTDDNETVYKRDTKNGTFAVSQIMNSDETTSSFQYDDQYNLLHSIDEKGTTRTFSYDANGNLKTSTDSNDTTLYEYDEKYRITKITDPSGSSTINTYRGENLSKRKIGEEITSFDYDLFGRETKVLYPNNTFEEVIYDDLTDTVTVRDANGQVSSTSYDQFGNVKIKKDAGERSLSYEYHPLMIDIITAVIDGKGKTTKYQYDKSGKLTKLTDALGRNKIYEYNDNNQVTKASLPGMLYTYHYNSNGNLDREVTPSGNILTYSYDEMDQAESVTVSNPSNGEVLKWDQTYNDWGLLSKVTFQDLKSNQNILQKSLDYNNLSLLASYTQGNFRIIYKYNENEQPLSVMLNYTQGVNPWKVEKSLTYTDEGNKDVQTVRVGDQKYMIFEKVVDLTNNQEKVIVNENLYQQTNIFNQSNLLEGVFYNKGTGTLLEYSYTYDGSGNILEEKSTNGDTRFTYDENSQLIQEVLPDGSINKYNYDDVGNRKESIRGKHTDTFKYNASNQIETKNGKEYLYDKDGNLLQDDQYKFEYNALGYQTRISDLQGNEIARYEYDETGLRTKKYLGLNIHEYYYDDTQLSFEVISKGDTIVQYRNYQWDEDTPLGMIIREKDESGNWKDHVFHYWTNIRGDVLTIRDNEGKEVGSYIYDSYGNLLGEKGSVAQENPIRYAGYFYDSESKNYYLKARYYNPANGSFLSLDPYSGDDNSISQNGYNYAGNNPVKYVDPEGHFWTYLVRGGMWVWKGGKWAWKKGKNLYKKVTIPTTKFSAKKLQKKFKHADDFGVKGNYSKKNAAKFEDALKKHIKNADEIIESKYHGDKVYVFLKGKKGVLVDPKGNFVSGWKFSSDQLNYHRKNGYRLK
ncbi:MULTISPECIES: DNRLRE domain-containing protein [Peribacillus]|uniref:DNRLRE domain-containing protein n=1 Tax=Peribacillus TaxID=2675229 RepID=UPI001F4E2B2D|nr:MULTISPECIES: DNRLRE domain-containing protein [unclassified Peribacillus]MCK1985796.1 DNRLRE domain-containing protein [Peribacillus sp. Aquil_B1]MCK2010722.1 DNRLRE domain-containing protein [Peribacillus sp. Aquil_B8]